MAHSANIFVRKETFDQEEWDDTALIEAYDRAMGAAKNASMKKLAMKLSPPTPPEKKKNKKKWKVGSFCEALYSKDNLLYEAVILEMNEEEGKCLVQFLGYENEEEVDIESLYLSQGKGARAKQIETVKCTVERQWEEGDHCLALFSEDNLYYPAKIKVIYEEDNCCLVKFIGYDNEEEVSLDNITPTLAAEETGRPHTQGNLRECSSVDESSSSLSSDISSTCSQKQTKSLKVRHPHESPHRPVSRNSIDFVSQLQLPEHFLPHNGFLDSASIAAQEEEIGPLLMSWYMAGYHTGYYQGRLSLSPSHQVSRSAHGMALPR